MDFGTSNSRASKIVAILKDLNARSNFIVHEKEICFPSAKDRKRYLAQFPRDPKDTLGLDSEMTQWGNVDGNLGTFFLLSSRDARGNKNTYKFQVARTDAQRKKVCELNGANLLDWHTTAMLYHQKNVYYYDAMYTQNDERRNIEQCIHFKSKLKFFIKSRRFEVKKVFLTTSKKGPGDSCRTMALRFIYDNVTARANGELCTKYRYNEVGLGTKAPAYQLSDRNHI